MVQNRRCTYKNVLDRSTRSYRRCNRRISVETQQKLCWQHFQNVGPSAGLSAELKDIDRRKGPKHGLARSGVHVSPKKRITWSSLPSRRAGLSAQLAVQAGIDRCRGPKHGLARSGVHVSPKKKKTWSGLPARKDGLSAELRQLATQHGRWPLAAGLVGTPHSAITNFELSAPRPVDSPALHDKIA
jgi:hypothetical protein